MFCAISQMLSMTVNIDFFLQKGDFSPKSIVQVGICVRCVVWNVGCEMGAIGVTKKPVR